ncbi:MAG: PTS system mannose/fructose/sorbose family transporter subunit IID, partial [Deltaproteobacteria bacterium]|nr:PTS system mannose/fructose/sorbose family transporter subunit IID [Deltaproteobacteria bacterium]
MKSPALIGRDGSNTYEPGQGPVENDPALVVSSLTMCKVAVRSLFLESTWNFIGQQSLGLLAAIEPALKVIYRDRPSVDLLSAKARAVQFFNTNPYSSGFVIGAALRLEEELKNNLITQKRRWEILSVLSSALAAQGDLLFWQSWLPAWFLVTLLAVSMTGTPLWALLGPGV